MSLLTETMEEYLIMNKISVDDGYGGYEYQWSEGATIKAAIDVPDSELAEIANKLTEKKNCHVVTERMVALQVNDYLQRKSDGLYFHILEDSRDNKTPQSAGISIRSHKAEILKTLPDFKGGAANG